MSRGRESQVWLPIPTSRPNSTQNSSSLRPGFHHRSACSCLKLPLHAHPMTLADPPHVRCYAAPYTPGSAGTWGSRQLSGPCPHSQTPAFPSADGFPLSWEQSEASVQPQGLKQSLQSPLSPLLAPSSVSVGLGTHSQAEGNSDIKEQWASASQEAKRPSMVLVLS